MGECTLTPIFGDFGDRKAILDVHSPRFEEAEVNDAGSAINGGPGIPTLGREEGKPKL